ncbi:hypothetical protein PAECIP111893_02764 [Paenibacillus plantiphilus]|uniref:Uncharacterized protein n=1 Tax=Paenibacillus plantiphilus TaxID=2905650 RepID=A0ABN8GKG2_9BACL|nr:hypothetical protein [Paenibacillus plantiphilus]CAH1207724.1 hypothetical protein PAECIP111893_02764 [Paenibacillus plantiphilus]
MENVSTGLKWAIGIILTLLIVAAGISVFMVTQGYFQRGQEQAVSQSVALAQSEFNNYENTTVTGTDVLEAIKRYKDRPFFSIEMKTLLMTGYNHATDKKCYSAANPSVSVTCTTLVTHTLMTDQTQATYVNPTARFKSSIYKDGNGVIRHIRFEQQ